VNIAARLEALADPGGVVISSAVFEQVRDRVPDSFEDLGEQQVKNIARPVRVYRYFADGMVEEIITALSRIRWLFVIARNSSFTYKGQAIDVKQVGRELAVRYVLEGSVRKAGGRVRMELCRRLGDEVDQAAW